jgi:hypothetical protein
MSNYYDKNKKTPAARSEESAGRACLFFPGISILFSFRLFIGQEAGSLPPCLPTATGQIVPYAERPAQPNFRTSLLLIYPLKIKINLKFILRKAGKKVKAKMEGGCSYKL